MITVYVSIGNSDDRLSQAEWVRFVRDVDSSVRLRAARVYGVWHSAPTSQYQNACWCFEVGAAAARSLRMILEIARQVYRQESIAWAVAQTEFIGPPGRVTSSGGDLRFENGRTGDRWGSTPPPSS